MNLFITVSLTLLVIVSCNLCSSTVQQTIDQSIDTEINDNSVTCDNEQCDSIVNKCTMTNRCPCNGDIHCLKDCIICMEEKFGKCCGCVGLCSPSENETHSSHVGNFKNDDPQLFEVLTETDDIHGRWKVERYRDGLLTKHAEHGEIELAFRSIIPGAGRGELSLDNSLGKEECVVAFINRHLSMAQCKKYCLSLGSAHFRWFHDGCCQCSGRYCLRYGINEPKCDIEYN